MELLCFVFLFEPLVMCITLHLHVQLVTLLELLYKKRMMVISSSFLEDAARNRLLCNLWLVYPFGNQAILILLLFSLCSIHRNSLCMLHSILSWRFNSESTQYSCICYSIKITVAYGSYLYIPM